MELTKKLQPIDGETLTSYIMRLSRFNYVSTSDFLKQIILVPENLKNNVTLTNRVDIKPQEYLDLEILSHFSGLTIETLISLSYIPLERKLIQTKIERRFELLRNVIDNKHRRFCPKCIQQFEKNNQTGVFKLIWQVSEIDICNIHNTSLTIKCPTCGSEQRYCADSLADYLCNSCYSKLYNTSSYDEMSSPMSDQQKQNYINWLYLLSNKSTGLIADQKMNYEVQVLVTLLFLLQREGSLEIDYTPQEVFSKNDMISAFRYIKYPEMPYFITPYRLLKGLKYMGLTAEEFFKIRVPNNYINRLLTYLKIDAEQLINRGVINKRKYRTCFKDYTSIQTKPAGTSGGRKITLERVEESIKLLIHNNEPITYKRVAEKAGVSLRSIKNRADLMDLIKSYKAAIKKDT